MIKKIVNILFVFCLIVSNLYVPKAYAKTLGDLKKELDEYEKQYYENKEQQKLNEQEKQKIKDNIYKIKLEIDEISIEIDELNIEIEQLNEEIIVKEKEIEDILIFTQISNGESAYLEYAFGAKDFTDFIYRIAVSEQLTTYNNDLVEVYKQNIEDNKNKTEELVLKQSQLTKKQSDLSEELIKIQESLEEIDELGLSIEEKIAAQKSYIKIYEDKGCKDNESIETCGDRLLPADTSFWRPIKAGYISGWYGFRDCSDPRISCFHNGLDMSSSGANTGNIPIYPVANGMVVEIVTPTYNSSTGKYNTNCGGKKIYIEHRINGKTYTSGYLHLRRIDVKKGDIVTKDTQIGLMGGYPASGYEYYDRCSTGSHLHLEISTGTFQTNIYGSVNRTSYDAYRSSPTNYINFPKNKYVSWYSRETKV